MIEQAKGTLWMKVALATACVVVAWMLYNLLSGPGRPKDSAVPAGITLPDPRSLAADLSYTMPPMTKFESILQRPIFSPTRRGVGGTAVVAVSQELDLKITGTVVTDSDRYAMVLPRGGQETVTLREGEDFRGWTVTRVHLKGVVFERGASQEEILMNYEAAPEPVKQRAKQRTSVRQKTSPQVRKQPTQDEEQPREAESAEEGDG